MMKSDNLFVNYLLLLTILSEYQNAKLYTVIISNKIYSTYITAALLRAF